MQRIIFCVLPVASVLVICRAFIDNPGHPGFQSCNTFPVTVCATSLGYISKALYTQNEVCSLFSETIYCLNHTLTGAGLHCSLSDIQTRFLSVLQSMSAIPSFLQLGTCKVPEESGSLCSTNRLWIATTFALKTLLFSLTAPSYAGLHVCSIESTMMPMLRSVNFLFGGQCPESALMQAVFSPKFESWVSRNYPVVNMTHMRSCFYLAGNKTYEKCNDVSQIVLPDSTCFRNITQSATCRTLSTVLRSEIGLLSEISDESCGIDPSLKPRTQNDRVRAKTKEKERSNKYFKRVYNEVLQCIQNTATTTRQLSCTMEQVKRAYDAYAGTSGQGLRYNYDVSMCSITSQ